MQAWVIFRFFAGRYIFEGELCLGDKIEQTREVAARYFNKEYYEASLTYLVTPSDYDKLTAAYFLSRKYPEDLCRPRFLRPRSFLRPLITDLISWMILYRGIVN